MNNHRTLSTLRRTVAMLLTLCMVTGMIPAGLAEEETRVPEEVPVSLATPTDLTLPTDLQVPDDPVSDPAEDPAEPVIPAADPVIPSGDSLPDEAETAENPETANTDGSSAGEIGEDAGGLFVLTTAEGGSIPASDGELRTIEQQIGDYLISATGVFPEGTAIQIVEIPMGAAEQMSGKSLLFAYDIRLVVNGEVWQPDASVKMSVKELNGGLEGKDVRILHVRNDLMDANGNLSEDALNKTLQDLADGTLETEKITTAQEDSSVVFDTSSFSTFLASAASALQTMLEDAMKKLGDVLNEKITITLSKDTKYEGDLDIDKGSYSIGNDFSVELVAEDAGDDNLQAGGTTVLQGNISVTGIAVKLAGFLLGAGNKITAKDNAKVDFFGTAKNDTVLFEANNSTVNISTGAGDDTVTLSKRGGDVTVDTGEGKDTVTAETNALNSGSLEIVTGEGEDSVTVTNNRGDLTVDTGDGDDTVKFTNKADDGTIGIIAGEGNDSVELDVQSAGQGITVTTGDGDDAVALTDSGDAAAAAGSVTVDTGKGINSVEVNLALAKAVDQLTVQSGEGNDHLHITGTLQEISGNSTNAEGKLEDFTLTEKDGSKLNFILPDGIESLTDDLENKRTVTLTPVSTGDNAGSLDYREAESFTNYVINAPSSSLKNIYVAPKQDTKPILSNVVIDTDTSSDGDNKLVVSKDTTVEAPDLTLVLKARNIEINGLLKAGQIQLEALDGTGMYRRNFKDQYEAHSSEKFSTPVSAAAEAAVDMLWDVVNIKDKATVTIGEEGRVYAAGDVIMLARVEQSGALLDLGSTFTSLLDTLADQVKAGASATSMLNAVNVKVGEAKIEIKGTVKAGVTGYDSKGNPIVGEGHGSVRADAEVRITEGYDSKDKLIDGIPVSVSVAYADASVNVAKSAVIESARDISLGSKTELKIGSRADSGLLGAPFAAAVSVVVDSAATTVDGELKAHTGDVRVAANANTDVRTLADKGEGQKILSGGYIAVAVALQDAKAALNGTAKVEAGGKVRVESRANEKVDTNATSAQVASEKEEEKDTSTGGRVKNIILDTLKETVWPMIKDAMKSSPTAQEKTEQAMKKVSSESHNAMLDDGSQSHGEVTVTDNTTAGQSTTYRVKVTPWTGYKVKSVTWRGYNPGGTAYLTGTASKNDDNNYTVTPVSDGTAVATVIIHVEYEEDTDYEEPTAADLFNEKEASDDVDLQALIDDLNSSTDDTDNTKSAGDGDDEEEFVDLKLEGVLTWETENDGKTCQQQTFAGDKIQILPNPPEGKKLKDGGIKVTYYVKGEDDKSTQKTTSLQADSKGRYYFTMPDDLMTGKDYSVTVKAEFIDAGTEDKKADENTTEVAGAIAVTVADNDSRALIDSGAVVVSGGKTEVVSETATNVTNVADGSPSGKPEDASGDDKKKEENEGTAIKRLEEETKTNSDGNGRAKYGLIVDETVNGKEIAVSKITADTDSKQNYDYSLTVTPAKSDDGTYEYSVAKVILVYLSGGEQKSKELTAENGKYSFNLEDSDLAIDEGTTAHISVSFAQDGRYGQNDTTLGQQVVLANPIRISYNTLKDEPSTATDAGYAGHIYYKGKDDAKGYQFEASAVTAKGYKLDGDKLTASWKDADGKEQTKDLTKDGNAWYLDPADIPAGVQIVVSGKFVDDLHELKDDSEKNGEVKLYDTKVKVTDKPQITVKPKAGYSVKEITVTYKTAAGTKTLTLTGGKVTKVKDKDSLYTFALEDQLAAESDVTVKVEYALKTIGIYAGSQDKDDSGDNAVYTLSEKNAAVGDTITLTLAEKHAKAGKKIVSITVTGGEVEISGNSFKIKDGTTATAKLTVTVELGDKAIALSETKLENGTVKPAVAKADWNDTVTVTVTPAAKYKVKQGSLKAIVRAKDGSSTDEIHLSRKNDTTYTFQMPSQNGRNASDMEVSFVGEFEPGESDSSTLETSIGAAISVSVTNSESRAEIKGKVTAGGAVNVNSAANGSAKTESKAGYSKGNIGIGGAVSVQVASMDSKALIHKDANIELDGQLNVDSKSELTFAVNADASGSKKEAKKTGVGAGIAVAVNGGDTFAAVQDGAAVKTHTKDAVKGIAVTANQSVRDTVTAKAGASGGTSVAPVAAVDVTGVQAQAYLGKVYNGKLKMTDGTAVSATASGVHTVSADASAAGKGVGVGAAIVVTVIADKADAKLNQSIEAGKVTVSAETTSKVEDTATASASGGKKEEDSKGKSPDKQADGLIGGAAKIAGKNKSSAVSGGSITDSTKDRQQAETSEGTVGVAGALVVNVQNSTSTAEILDGVSIKASDLIAVTAVNGTTSKVKANGSTTNSDKGVGVGIAINIIGLDNIARMGDGEFEAAMLKVTAETKMTEPEKKEEKKKEDKTDSEDKLEKDLGEKAGEFINNLIHEIGLDQYISKDLLGEIVSPVVTAATKELIKASGIKEYIGDGTISEVYEKNKAKLSDAWESLKALPEQLLEPLMDVLEMFDDIESLDETEFGELKDRILAQFVKELTGKLESAGKSILDEFKEGMIEYLKENAGDLLSGAISDGLATSDGKIFDEAKKVISKSVKKQIRSFINEVISDTLLHANVPGLDEQNKDRIKKVTDAFSSMKDAYERESLDKIFGSAADYVTDKVREVFDYEAMLTKLAKTDFKKTITEGLRNAAKTAQVTLGNEILGAMSNHFGLKIEPEEEKATGHVITTQAIAGAGAREVGVAGSVAVTVLNGETGAEIADGGKITVSKGMTVSADETRLVKNAASAAVNADGDAEDNKKEANKDKDIGGGNDAGTRANGLHVSMETAPGASLSIRQGDKAQAKPRIYITLKEGYKLPEEDGKQVVKYTYKDENDTEKTGSLEISKTADGELYVDPSTGDLASLDEDRDVTLQLTPVEILRSIGKPDLLTDGSVTVEEGAVTVEVKDRETEKDDDGKEILQAREGETVKITIARKEGRKVTGVGYSWKDADGKTHDVELNGTDIGKSGKVGAEKAFTLVSSSKDEYVYSITMPAGEITDIVVVFEAGSEGDADDSETTAKDEEGKSIGVGAAFSIVYGGRDVKALVGRREITAGDIAVTAASAHKEDISAAAGTDPVGEKTDEDDIKDVSVDASIALNILDNDIKAGISAGTVITTTGYTAGEGDSQETKDGDLSVTAKEESVTETTASAFAVGGKTAVGASVAVNIAITEVTAEMNGKAEITGSAAIAGTSHSEDSTKALATAMGADIARSLNKLNEKAENLEEKTNKLLDGSYVDQIGKEDKKSTETNKKINKRLDEKKQEKGKETSNKNSTSSNVLRSLGVTAQGNDAGSEGTSEASTQIKKTTDQDIDVGSAVGGDGDKKEKNWQVAAAVGVTVADHEVRTSVGEIKAGKSIAVTAENSGNFNTMGTGAAMSKAKRASSIAAGVAVSVNDNQARVNADGSLLAGEDLSVTSKVTQNLDGDFAGKLAVQSLSGSVAGNNSSISLGGAISVLVSTAESTVDIAGGSAEAARRLEGKSITVEATDKSRLGARAGGLSISKGSTVGMGIASSNVISENIVTATIGSNTEITGNSFRLNAEKQAVTSDDLKLLDWSYLITDSSDLSDEKRKEADTGLIDMHKGDDDESYKVDINFSSDKLLQAFDALNFLSGQNTYVEAIAGSVMTQAKRDEDDAGENGSKLSLAGSFAVAVTNNTIKAKLGDNIKVNVTKDTDHTGDVTVNAANGATTRIIAGSMSASPAKASVGATVAVLVTGDEITAETGNDATINADGEFVHSAETQADIQLFTAAMSVAAGDKAEKAAGGAINVIVSRNKAENKTGSGIQVTSGKSAIFNAAAHHDMMAISAAGNVTVSSSKDATYAAGGTVNVIVDQTKALNTLNLKKVTAEKDVSILADVENQLISGTAAVSAAVGKDSKAGAGVVSLVISGSKADSTVSGETDITAKTGSLKARAHNDALLVNASLSAAGAKETAVGLAFNVNIINRMANVNLESGKLTAGEDILVQADGKDTDIMAGLAVSGSVQGSAGSGNFIVAYESNKVTTKVEDKITAAAGRNAVFESYFSDFTVGAGGNVAVSGSGKSFGATVLTVIKNNDILTEMGASTVTADAAGSVETKALNGSNVSGVHIGAEAQESQYFVAAGVAGSKDLAMNGEIVVLVNNNTVLADAAKTVLNAEKNEGSVSVTAKDETYQLLLAGGVSFSASSSAVGAAVVTLVSNKTIDAKAHDIHADSDVSVTADNHDKITMLAVSAGGSGGGAAIEIGAAVQVLKSHARATVGSDVTVENGSFNLKAANNTDLINLAGAVAASTGGAAMTPVAAITYFEGEAKAVILPGSTLTVKKGDANITTESNKDISLITLGVSAGTGFGLSGAANILVSKDKAYAGVRSETEPEYKGTDISKAALDVASGSLKISAKGDYKLRAVSGAIAASSSAAVGVNAVVSIMKSQIVAELGGDATVGRDLNVKATSNRDIINAAATLAAGQAAGGITVMVLSAGTKMSQDAADMIARGNGDDKDKKTGFDATLFMDSAEKAGINFKLINANETEEDRKLNASILEEDIAGNGHRESEESVGHTEEDEDGKKQNTFDGASGYRSDEIDTKDNDSSNDANRGESMEASDTDDIDNAKKMNTYTYSDEDLPEDAVIARILGGETVSANTVSVEAAQGTTADMIGAAIGVGGSAGIGISTVVAMLHSNVLASSLADIIKAPGGVTVKAESKAGKMDDHYPEDRDDTVLDLMSNKPTNEDASEEEKKRAEEDKKSTMEELKDKISNRSIRAFGLAVGAGGTVGLGVSAAVVLTDNITHAVLGGNIGSAEKKVGEVNVTARHDYGTVMAATGALAAGMFAAGASVSVAQADGSVKAVIDDNAKVYTDTGKDINVESDANVGVDSIAVTAGAGLGSINAAVALSFNRMKQETGIGGGTTVDSGKDINIKAVNKTTGNNYLLGVSLGLAGINLNAAVSDVDAEIDTHIGTAAKESAVTAAGDISVKNDTTSKAVPRVISVAAGGVAAGGNVLLAFNNTQATAAVRNSTVNANNLKVVGDLAGEATSSLASVQVGAIAVGLSVNYADMQADNRAAVLDSELNLKGDLIIRTGEGKDTGTSASADTLAASMGLITVGVNAAIARNNTKNYAVLTGTRPVTVGGDMTVHGAGASTATATVKGIDIGLASVAVSAVVALNDADARTKVDLKQATVTGMGYFNGTQDAATTAKMTTGGGSLLSVKVSAAVAYGRAKSQVDVDIRGKNSFAGVSSMNNAADVVTADIENCSFDIISAAGRFAGAYSQDAFTTNIIFSGPSTEIGKKNVDVQTVYTMTSDATVTPSSRGVDVSLGSLAVNVAIAKNTAKANASFEAIKGTAHVAGDVNVKAVGTANTKSNVRTASIAVGGISLGANIAKADLSVTQEAHMRVGGTLTVDGKVDVQSLANTAKADATIAGMGGKKGISVKLANLDVSKAIARENMTSSATVLGGPVAEVEETMWIDEGKYVEKTTGHFDYELVVDGRYIVRDDNGEVKYETTTVTTYNTGEWEERNAVGDVIDGSMDPKYDGKRKVRSVKTRNSPMVRFGEHFEWIEETETVWEKKMVAHPYKVNVYNPDENKLHAASLNIFSGAVEGTETGATASTRGPMTVGLFSAGSHDAKAVSTDSFAVVFEGMTATIDGDATLKASTATKSYAEGTTPGGFSAIEAYTSDVTSQVGERNDKQTVSVVIGKGNTLEAKNIFITTENKGHAHAYLDQGTTGALATIKKSSQPTESWYNTLVSVGREATLKASGDITIISSDAPSATSKINTEGFSLTLNFNTMQGKNTIDQENNLDIGVDAKVKAGGDILLKTAQKTIADAMTNMNGGGVLEGSTARSENTIYRIARINVDQNAEISGRNVTLNSVSGEGDNISTYSYVGSKGLVALGEAKAYTNLENHAEIIVYDGVKITAGQKLTLDAQATSYNDANPNHNGVRTQAIVDSAALVPLPQTVARNNIDLTSFVAINRDPDEGKGTTERKKAVLTSENNDILVNASNEKLSLYAYTKSVGKGLAGTSNANAWNAATLTNAVWIDDATFTAKNIRIYADNGGTLKDNDESLKPYIMSESFAELKGIGKVAPDSRITGVMINQIRSYNTDHVTFNVPEGGQVIHKTTDPWKSINQYAKVGIERVKILGIPLAKDGSNTVLEWAIYNRCDFCGEGMQYDVEQTKQKTTDQRYEDAFNKALAPVNEIQRMVNNSTIVMKARYAEEDYTTAAKRFALDVKHILTKDITLESDEVASFRMWTNTETRLNVYLLPNAARLYTNGIGRLQYAVDVISGDLFNDGSENDIEILTALTANAFANPIIPIGSTGSLNLTTGLLTLPSHADYELFLSEVSGAWLRDKLASGFIRRLIADQEAINACAISGESLPDSRISENLTSGMMTESLPLIESADEVEIFWVGETPETVTDPDTPLVYLLVNHETDEVDAYRTSVNMLNNGEAPVDVSLYLYRDSKSDRQGEEKYNVMFFDTPEGQESLVKCVTSVLFGRTLEMPMSMKIVLRGRYLEGADKPVYCLTNHVFILCDGTDGEVNVLGGYHATFDGDTFDSNYTTITGIRNNWLAVTMKKDQPVWAELTGETTAEDPEGNKYYLEDGEWYPEVTTENGVQASEQHEEGTF